MNACCTNSSPRVSHEALAAFASTMVSAARRSLGWKGIRASRDISFLHVTTLSIMIDQENSEENKEQS